MSGSNNKRGALLGAALGIGATLALVIGLGFLAGAGAAASSDKPVNTSAPSILSGTAQVGEKLNASDGAWKGATSYNYFWTRCDKNGNKCSNIGKATSKTYTVTSDDVGHTLRFKVEAMNKDGSTSLSSDQTAVVIAADSPLPHNTSPPTISGTPQEGKTLTGDDGKWTGKPSDFNHFWLRCDKSGGSCSTISGTAGKTYTLTSADVGNTLRFKVEAKNANGSNSATSVPTAVITSATKPPPPPPPTTAGCPSGSGTINIADLSSPAKLLIDQQQTSPAVVNSGTNQLVARYHVTACKGRSVQGALVYATAVPFNQLSIPPEQTTGSDGWAELDFHMLAGFPVSSKQGLIAIFARARKSGENILGGISSRRLFSVQVNLHG